VITKATEPCHVTIGHQCVILDIEDCTLLEDEDEMIYEVSIFKVPKMRPKI